MADDVSQGNRNQQCEEHIVDLRRLRAGTIKEDGQEADRNVKNLAGYLMPMDLWPLGGGLKKSGM